MNKINTCSRNRNAAVTLNLSPVVVPYRQRSDTAKKTVLFLSSFRYEIFLCFFYLYIRRPTFCHDAGNKVIVYIIIGPHNKT